jgi:hypothetical protein
MQGFSPEILVLGWIVKALGFAGQLLRSKHALTHLIHEVTSAAKAKPGNFPHTANYFSSTGFCGRGEMSPSIVVGHLRLQKERNGR